MTSSYLKRFIVSSKSINRVGNNWHVSTNTAEKKIKAKGVWFVNTRICFELFPLIDRTQCSTWMKQFLSFAAPNYAPYRPCFAKVNNEVFSRMRENTLLRSHIKIRLRHEVNSIERIIRDSKGLDMMKLFLWIVT